VTIPARSLWQRFQKPRTYIELVVATLVAGVVTLPFAWLLLGGFEDALVVIGVASAISLVGGAVRVRRGVR
jgi:hypothetical protein